MFTCQMQPRNVWDVRHFLQLILQLLKKAVIRKSEMAFYYGQKALNKVSFENVWEELFLCLLQVTFWNIVRTNETLISIQMRPFCRGVRLFCVLKAHWLYFLIYINRTAKYCLIYGSEAVESGISLFIHLCRWAPVNIYG